MLNKVETVGEIAEDIKLVRDISFMNPTKYKIFTKKAFVTEYVREITNEISCWLLKLEKIDFLENFIIDEVGNINRIIVNKVSTKAVLYGDVDKAREVRKAIGKVIDDCVKNIILDMNCYTKTDDWQPREVELILSSLELGLRDNHITSIDKCDGFIPYIKIKSRLLEEVINKGCDEVRIMLQDGTMESLIISSISEELQLTVAWLVRSAQIDTARRVAERLVGDLDFEDKIRQIEKL